MISAGALFITILIIVFIAIFANDDYKWERERHQYWADETLWLSKRLGEMIDNRHRGSKLDDFLEENGILEECTAAALRRAADLLEEKDDPQA